MGESFYEDEDSSEDEGMPDKACLSQSNDRDYERALLALEEGVWPPLPSKNAAAAGSCSMGDCRTSKGGPKIAF